MSASKSVQDAFVLLGFPYLRTIREIPADSFRMWICSSPLLFDHLAAAKEWQIDPTYNEAQGEGGKPFYLINVSAFSSTSLRWITGCRIRLNSKSSLAYTRAFCSFARLMKKDHPGFSFAVLEAILVDFESAQITGLI